MGLAVAAMFCGGTAYAEMRIWEDTSGKQVKAEFDRELFGAVELRRPDGSLYSIPLENLSAQDLNYLRTRIPPEIELNIRTQKKGKVRNEDFARTGDTINVITATVEIRQKSSAVFNGILRMEVYLIGREVATADYRLSGKETFQVQFTEENKRRQTVQTSADFRVYEEYNNLQTRGAEYAGYLVVVIDPQGDKLAIKTDLSWLREEDRVDELRKFHVDSFFDQNVRKRSVPRPKYYEGRIQF
jgi:hypothetical protein